MSSNIGRYTPAAGVPISVDSGLPWEYIRIINSSPYMLSVAFGGQGTIDFPEMYLEDIPISPSYNGKITITPIANISNPTSALTNYISINVYQRGELVNPQAQPLTTMSNVGNSVPLQAQATSVVNDGNPGGTTVVEATPSGGSQSVLILNDGTVTVGGKVTGKKALGGINTGYFEMAPSDGVTWDIGELSATHGAAFFTAGVAQLEINPTKGTRFRAGGLYLGGISEFSGTVTGTYNHNFGGTPDGCLLCQSVIGSQTMGYDTLGATTVHVTSGSGNAFYGTAYAMN